VAILMLQQALIEKAAEDRRTPKRKRP